MKRQVEAVSRFEWWVILIVPILLLALVGGGTWYVVDTRIKAALQEQLQATLRANRESLLLWLDSEFARARNQLRLTQVPLADDAQQIAARSRALEAVRQGLDARAVSLFALEGRTVASTESRSFTKSFALSDRALSRLRKGQNALIDVRRPFTDEPAWIGLGVPLAADGQSSHALLVYFPASATFSRTLAVARVGESGESYAFGSNGELYSESRFPAHLRAIGLVAPTDNSTILSIRLADPGTNLVERGQKTGDPARWPLTRMAASATRGQDGSDTGGYRDYRGVPVVGAWEWLDELGFGIATEIDVDEAYQPSRAVIVGFGVMVAFMALMSAGLVWLHASRRSLGKEPRLTRDSGFETSN